MDCSCRHLCITASFSGMGIPPGSCNRFLGSVEPFKGLSWRERSAGDVICIKTVGGVSAEGLKERNWA